MLRLLSFKAQRREDFSSQSKPCHIGIHWIALAEDLYEYLCAMVSVIFQALASFRNGQIIHQQHKV